MIRQLTFLLSSLSSISLHAMHQHAHAIQRLLPEPKELVETYTDLEGGMSNTIVLCETPHNEYIFRCPRKAGNKERFNNVLAVAKRAADLGISPQIYGADDTQQHILMKYVKSATWPLFSVNPQPYLATMGLLKRFHDEMRPSVLTEKKQVYAPFTAILKNRDALLSNPLMPEQLARAYERTERMNSATLPWLDTQRTVYHGDFKRDNVLLRPVNGEFRPWIIDFDSMGVGHPYFDVVKFSQRLLPDERAVLFNAYLDRDPTMEETEQFEILDNALRMVVADIRLNKMVEMLAKKASVLSKRDMEELLNSADPLPAQSTQPFGSEDMWSQQMGTVYALHDFLRNTRQLIN